MYEMICRLYEMCTRDDEIIESYSAHNIKSLCNQTGIVPDNHNFPHYKPSPGRNEAFL